MISLIHFENLVRELLQLKQSLYLDTLIFLLLAVSGCRFYCRFRLPFLVAVWQGQIAQGILLGIEEFENLGTKTN